MQVQRQHLRPSLGIRKLNTHMWASKQLHGAAGLRLLAEQWQHPDTRTQGAVHTCGQASKGVALSLVPLASESSCFSTYLHGAAGLKLLAEQLQHLLILYGGDMSQQLGERQCKPLPRPLPAGSQAPCQTLQSIQLQ